MKSGFQCFSNWGIATKLVVLFTIFGLVPMAAVGYLGTSATGDMEDAAGARFQGVAENLADKIDRNLFERYGDVQVFGSNRIVEERYNWYSTEDNEIADAMDQYVATLGVYYLMIFVDPVGDVIAVNAKDAQGEPLDTTALYKKNYANAPWLMALQAEEYTTTQPFSAPGNDRATGTFIEDLHVDEDVKAVYPGEDGLVLGFSAPVYADGEIIGYWTNRAKFSLVEEMVQSAYQELKNSGYPKAEITLLGDKGQVFVDYDPAMQGTEDMTHNLENVLFTLNLAEKGVVAAQAAVAGESGYLQSEHARKQIMQLTGYTHLQGASGFPGMNWSVLVRSPKEEAAAAAVSFNRNLMITVVVCVGLILVVGFWVGRRGARQVRNVQDAADKMAAGDYEARVLIRSQDEIGQLGNAFNTMASEIQTNITRQEQANQEMLRIKTALDNAGTNVMICDRDLNIIYVNKNSVKTLEKHEQAIQQSLPDFAASKVVGSNIDQYHKNPSHQRQLLDDPRNLPHRADIQLGPLTLTLNIGAIMSDSGDYVGNVVEWADVTTQKKAEKEVEQLISAAASGQLSERIDTKDFEGFFKQLATGVNRLMDAVSAPLAEAQAVLTALASGDLTKQVTGSYEGEFGKIKVSLNSAIANLTSIVQSVREGAGTVSTAAEEITKGNEDLSERTSSQAGALEETSASMEEMTSTIKQNADNAKQANQLAVTAREVAEKGGTITDKAVDAMSEINKSSKKIADIITVIDEIAFQTNLLALNAAVEAARAGEQGRGFAVVASEVRNLAQRSATAAKEIKSLINESVQKVGDGSELVNQSGQTLAEIVNSVKRVTDIISEISAASQEQAAGIDQVNKAIMQMDQGTQQNAALVEEATSASQSMRQQAAELTNQVSFFKLGEEEASGKNPAQSAMTPRSQSVSPTPAPKASPKPQPVSVGSNNGHSSSKDADDFFEEF